MKQSIVKGSHKKQVRRALCALFCAALVLALLPTPGYTALNEHTISSEYIGGTAGNAIAVKDIETYRSEL